MDLNIIPPNTKQRINTKEAGIYFIIFFDNILNVVRFVICMDNITIAIGSSININQSVVDKDNVAIKPVRAECAVAKIINIIGAAHIKPTVQAIVLIFATIICICFAMNLSVAPIWFNISSSCWCNIAMFLDI